MFQSSHAENTTWQSALQDCLDKLDENMEATIGFVYVTDVVAPHLSSILEILKDKTGIDSWVGSASPGICSISSRGACEYFGVPAITPSKERLSELAAFVTAFHTPSESEVDDDRLHTPVGYRVGLSEDIHREVLLWNLVNYDISSVEVVMTETRDPLIDHIQGVNYL